MYEQPTFNLTCNLKTGPLHTVTRLSPICNLAWGRRVNVASTGGTSEIGVPLVTVTLLLPALTDIRGPQSSGGPDLVEVPAGSGRTYLVAMVDDIGKGFANEHRAAVLQQTGIWPTPIP